MFDRSMHELQLPPRMSCCGIDNPSIVWSLHQVFILTYSVLIF
jgi:hypothetical protein